MPMTVRISETFVFKLSFVADEMGDLGLDVLPRLL